MAEKQDYFYSKSTETIQCLLHNCIFSSNCKINLIQPVLNHHSEPAEKRAQAAPISDAKLKRICANVKKDMKRKLDADGRWKKSFETFSIDAHDDFWQITNGHDILSAVRYVVPTVAISFPNIGGYSQNRAYEFALSAEYDYHCFADTELYNKLFSNGLIVACV